MSQPVFVMPGSATGSQGERGHSSSLQVVSAGASDHDGHVAVRPSIRSVAVVGLGYVGLPTALGLHDGGLTVYGTDVSSARVDAIREGAVDLVDQDRERLGRALRSARFETLTGPSALPEADAVIICVPTPLDGHLAPELGPVSSACRTVVQHARAGQTIVLTSTSYVGTTRRLLVEPLQRRGFVVGEDVFVAFSPERIDPGVPQHAQSTTPRVVGGVSATCAARARALLSRLSPSVHLVSTPEAAEMTKLYENTFRAVTLALANEFAEICGALALDPIEVTEAAGTKPYGFLTVYPGPGVGGHCIPCDPHYLLWQLREERFRAPLTEQAMASIAARPRHVVRRALELLSDAGAGLRGARVLVVGVTYKPGVQDLRESSALEILLDLRRRGADVGFHDPLIPAVTLADGTRLENEAAPAGGDWDLVLVHTLHPGVPYSWIGDCPRVLDGTYRLGRAAGHAVV